MGHIAHLLPNQHSQSLEWDPAIVHSRSFSSSIKIRSSLGLGLVPRVDRSVGTLEGQRDAVDDPAPSLGLQIVRRWFVRLLACPQIDTLAPAHVRRRILQIQVLDEGV